MYKTIEAIYEDGRVYPKEKLTIKKARVLLTIIGKEKRLSKRLTTADVTRFTGSLTLEEDPLIFQKKIRNEWK